MMFWTTKNRLFIFFGTLSCSFFWYDKTVVTSLTAEIILCIYLRSEKE